MASGETCQILLAAPKSLQHVQQVKQFNVKLFKVLLWEEIEVATICNLCLLSTSLKFLFDHFIIGCGHIREADPSSATIIRAQLRIYRATHATVLQYEPVGLSSRRQRVFPYIIIQWSHRKGFDHW